MNQTSNNDWMDAALPVVIGLIMLVMLFSCVFAHAETLPKDRIVMAEIGEAESSGLEGMRCVASSIIWNRKTLRGVFGEKSKRVTRHLYSPHTFVLAVQAYEDSLKHDYSDGSSVWGNRSDLKIFRQSKWFKKMVFVKECGENFYYRKDK